MDLFDPRERLEFERLLQWLRLGFLLTPALVLIAFGTSAVSYAVMIAVAASVSYGWVWLLAQLRPDLLLRFQLLLRAIDCGLVYLVLINYHAFLRNAYYDSVYVLFVLAAAATHGRRGAWSLSILAGILVLVGRLQLIAADRLAFETRHLTDAAYYTLFFGLTSTAVAFLMQRSAAVASRRELAWREELCARNAELEQTAAQLEQAVRSRDAMVSALSHDLRTPLTVVKVHAQLAARRAATLSDPTAERLSAGIAQIDRVATRMTRWIDELLEAMRSSGGGELALERQAIDLVQLAREAVAEHQASTPGHELSLETPDDGIVGQWDATRLERVIDNLLANAVKYSPAGGPIWVGVSREDGWARLVVRDQGVGIPAEDLAHIFEPFMRGSNVVGRFGGIGIGLAGSSHIIRQHGGTIEVESQPGSGTTFIVRLPLEPPESDL